MHNHAHQVNYTAGFVCAMECCGERQCECGSLPAESIDRKAALAVGFKDFDLSDDTTNRYFEKVAAYLIGTALGQYFKKSMAQKRNSDGGAKYTVDCTSAHEGVEGNEQADATAKAAAQRVKRGGRSRPTCGRLASHSSPENPWRRDQRPPASGYRPT